MTRMIPALAALALALPAQDLPTIEEPPLPTHGPPNPAPDFIRLIPEDILGTWHGIETGADHFMAWEVTYNDDGSYRLHVLNRMLDTGETAEEASSGTWKLTPDGLLDLDGGEVLFKAIDRDERRTIYLASSPGEPDTEPWTLHEFAGVAPEVIFDLAPVQQGNAPEPSDPNQEETQLANLRQLLLGCSAYAVEHGGRFPARLSALEPNFGAEVLADLRMFTNPANGIRTPWKVVAGRTITNPHDTILMHSPSYGDGKRMTGFINGTATILTEAEFKERQSR
jgi:hypothetical protein